MAKVRPPSIGAVRITFIVDRYLSDNNYSQTRSTFRTEASELTSKSHTREAPKSLLSLGVILDGVYREMRDDGFEPDVVTYGIIVNAHYKAKKYNEAIRVFHKMESNNIKPTPHIYCTLFNGSGSEKRLSEALKFVELSKAGGFIPEAPTYNALVGSCCCSNRIYDAYKVVDERRKCGIAECKYLRDHGEDVLQRGAPRYGDEGKKDTVLILGQKDTVLRQLQQALSSNGPTTQWRGTTAFSILTVEGKLGGAE
ncbi:hypothetical protein U1Q18_028190 [Sarracenia purpurea var. burkii]